MGHMHSMKFTTKVLYKKNHVSHKALSKIIAKPKVKYKYSKKETNLQGKMNFSLMQVRGRIRTMQYIYKDKYERGYEMLEVHDTHNYGKLVEQV